MGKKEAITGVIVAAGAAIAALIGAGSYHRGTCTKCGKKLTGLNRKYECVRCRKVFCSDCMERVNAASEVLRRLRCTKDFIEPDENLIGTMRLCSTCAKVFYDQVNRMEMAGCHADDVELVSINYQGKKRYVGKPIEIQTGWRSDKNSASKDLKVLAAYYDCDMVLDVEVFKDQDSEETESGGTYVYNIKIPEMSRVFRITPRRIRRVNNTVLTPEMTVTVTTRSHTSNPFNNGAKEVQEVYMRLYNFDYRKACCTQGDFEYEALD